LAPDQAARAQVAADIEASAASEAQTIKTSSSYLPPASSTAGRDQFCAAHGATTGAKAAQ